MASWPRRPPRRPDSRSLPTSGRRRLTTHRSFYRRHSIGRRPIAFRYKTPPHDRDAATKKPNWSQESSWLHQMTTRRRSGCRRRQSLRNPDPAIVDYSLTQDARAPGRRGGHLCPRCSIRTRPHVGQ
jgi:hypothetical protein